jgi:ubiquinone/menaquinone biosynthesis C-methylase UbiE
MASDGLRAIAVHIVHAVCAPRRAGDVPDKERVMARQPQVRDAMQFVNEQDAATRERFIERLELRGKDPTFVAYREAYLELLDLPRAAAVVELGCGTGVVARAIAARDGFAGTVTGIDLSADFIAAAETFAADEGVGDRVRFAVGDAHELAFPVASFDAAVAHTLVSHVRDPLAVLVEAARVVRPGGFVAVFDGDYASLTFGCSDRRLGEVMEPALRATIMSSPRVMRELPRLLSQAGLQLIASQAHVFAEAGSSTFMLNLAETYAPLAASNGQVSAAQVDAWLADQRRSAAEGTFFAACNYYAYVART